MPPALVSQLPRSKRASPLIAPLHRWARSCWSTPRMLTQKSAPVANAACGEAVLLMQMSSDGGSVLRESTAVAAMAKRSEPLLVLMMVTDLARRRMAWSMSAFRLMSFIALALLLCLMLGG